jgi:hypothetical protein
MSKIVEVAARQKEPQIHLPTDFLYQCSNRKALKDGTYLEH